jgi:hypothetical protein
MHNGNMMEDVQIAKALTLEPYERPLAVSADECELAQGTERGHCEMYYW